MQTAYHHDELVRRLGGVIIGVAALVWLGMVLGVIGIGFAVIGFFFRRQSICSGG